MSVINDMLRDLDKRQAPEVSGVDQPPHESLIEPQAPAYKKWAILVVGLLVLAISVYFYLNQKNNVLPTISAQNVSEQSSASLPMMTDNITLKEELVDQIDLSDEVLPNTNDSVSAHDEPKVLKAEPTQYRDQSPKAELAKKSSPSDTGSLDNKSISNIEPLVNSDSLPREEPLVKKAPSTAYIATREPPLEHVRQVEIKALKVASSDSKTVAGASMGESDPSSSGKAELPLETAMDVKLSPMALDQQMAKRATKLLSQRQELKAYRELYQFIGEQDVDTASRAVLASYLLKENRLAEVGDVLLNAPLDKSPKLRQIKARWYVAQGKPNLAIYTLRSDLPEISDFPEYYVLLAAYYQRYGSTMDASKTYALLVDFDESIADWWAGLGLASDRNGEKEKAIFAYRQALELNGLSPELLNFVKPRLQQLLKTLPGASQSSGK